ncbi:MAG: methyltransferase MtaB domain-containing protein, partial [Armatimonadota bacterium]
MVAYDSVAIDAADELYFGRCLAPVTTRRGLRIGAGTVYPELNFTLPAVSITEESWPRIV